MQDMILAKNLILQKIISFLCTYFGENGTWVSTWKMDYVLQAK